MRDKKKILLQIILENKLMNDKKKIVFAFCTLGAAALASAFIFLNLSCKRKKTDFRLQRINNLLEEAENLIKKHK